MVPLIIHKEIKLSPPTMDDRRAHDQRIRDTLGLHPLTIPLSVLHKLATACAGEATTVACTVCRKEGGYALIDIGSRRSCSLALDLGTTNLVFTLYDNAAEREIGSISMENPQIAYGSDILTRMHNAMSPASRDVYDALRQGINQAVRTVCRRAGIRTGEIHALVAAGNTVMSHFFLGLDVGTIPVDPFVPVTRTPGFFTAAALGLDLNPEAAVYVFPNAGSYVGGDIIAGIIATGLYRSDKPSVLIDVGTNAEVVIGTRDWMLVGAGAAGPALEEGICRIGRRASTGIIYDVEITGTDVRCKTFDQLSPEGICGSGMVSLLHALYGAGIIDKSGTFIDAGGNFTSVGDERAFAIVCGGGDPLLIRQSEIRNFIKSKAAMFTLLLVLVRSVGLAFRDISQVFVSGALGTGIDAGKAVAVGMLPAWPSRIVKPAGNTSLKGALMLIRDGGLVETINAVTEKITYKHMHDDPEFMKEFMGAVFIPHTNPELLKAE